MDFSVGVAEIVAFVVFVLMVAPALTGVGYLMHRVNSLESWLKTHVAETSPMTARFLQAEGENRSARDQRDRMEEKLDRLGERIEEIAEQHSERWMLLANQVTDLKVRMERVERLLNGGTQHG